MDFDLGIVLRNGQPLLEGFRLTLLITLVALAIGIAGGAVVCAGRLSRRSWIRRIAGAYVTFFRTTPEMILIFWGYYCLPRILGGELSSFWTGSLALGLVTAAYAGEIFRAGVEAVPKGQFEAAEALGLPRLVRWRSVILPQALRQVIGPLMNYFTELVKNTTLLSAIGTGELALQASLLGGQTFRYLEFLTAIAVGYFIIIFPITMLSRRFEVRPGTRTAARPRRLGAATMRSLVAR